jgi:hypothetical protein
MLERQTFPNPELGAYTQKHYLAYRLDGEKGEGPKLANQYRVRAYPTLLFLDPTGKELGRQVGFVDAPTLLRLLQSYYASFDKNQSQKAPSWEDFQEAYPVYVASLLQIAWGGSFSASYQQWKQAIEARDYEAAQRVSSALASPARETFEALMRWHRGENETALRILHYDLFAKGKLSPDQIHWVAAYQVLHGGNLSPEAMQWMNYVVRKEPSGKAFLTQAAVAYRLGRPADAQTALKEAQKEIPAQDRALATLQQLVTTAQRQK